MGLHLKFIKTIYSLVISINKRVCPEISISQQSIRVEKKSVPLRFLIAPMMPCSGLRNNYNHRN